MKFDRFRANHGWLRWLRVALALPILLLATASRPTTAACAGEACLLPCIDGWLCAPWYCGRYCEDYCFGWPNICCD